MTEKGIHFNLHLDKQTHKRLRIAAAFKECTMTALVQELIVDFLLWEEKQRKERYKPLGG